MGDPVQRAKAFIESILCGAVIASPLDPGLTVEEIRTIALKHEVGPGAFDAAFGQLHDTPTDKLGRFLPSFNCWGELNIAGVVKVPPNVRPDDVIDSLAGAFDELDNSVGPTMPKELLTLRSHLPAAKPEDTDRALGLLLSWGFVTAKDGGFVRLRRWPKYGGQVLNNNDFPANRTQTILTVLPTVTDLLAARTAAHVANEPALERFARFLRKQGWSGLEGWWSLTGTELHALQDSRHTSAICVLAAALLEAALVAIADHAAQAKEWRNQFLNRPPETWKLGDLIDQAESAGTFTPSQAALARELADLRNRIHAGRFSTAGKPPFSPPYADVHDATEARSHLNRLVAAILDWPPIAALC